MGYLELGEPPFKDVEGAARLLVKYEQTGKRGREFYEMFVMSVYDWDAVRARANELKRAA